MTAADVCRRAVPVVLLAAGSASAAPAPDAIRGTRDSVFNRPEFRSGPPGDNWLIRAIRDFFQWLGDLHVISPLFFYALIAGCILALVLLIGFIVWRVSRAFAANRGFGTEDPGQARRRMLSEFFRQEALRLAAAEDYTEAIRHLFLSLVYRFDERGRVSLDTAYTNREYLDLLDDASPARSALRVMVDLLDVHWYGQRPCDERHYRDCLRDYERLVAIM